VQSLDTSAVGSIVIGLVVVAFVCYRQLQSRPVREDRGVLIFLILLVFGLYQAFTFMENTAVSTDVLVITVASLIVGVGLGLLRGRLVHLWRSGGKLLRRGNGWTIVIWIIGLGIHLGTDFVGSSLDRAAAGFATNTLLVYIALSLGAQRFIVLRRAKSIAEHPDEAPTHY
jgi:hypothetical protein